MPRQAAILVPELVRTAGNMFIQKPVAPDSTNTFKAGALLTLTAGVLVLIASDGVLCYGQVPDISHAATEMPPQAMFGETHYVFSPLEGEFEINVGVVTAGALVIGVGAQTPANVTIGTVYGIATPTSGIYAGVQVLDPTEITATLFQVVSKVDNVLNDDYNGRVRVKIIPSKIQN